MNRNDLINKLVARKMTANGQAGAGCVPCFGSPARAYCICWPAPAEKSGSAPAKQLAADPKN